MCALSEQRCPSPTPPPVQIPSRGLKEAATGPLAVFSTERPFSAQVKPSAMASKLDQLRELLRTADGGNPVSAFIIPTEDAHMVRGRVLGFGL